MLLYHHPWPEIKITSACFGNTLLPTVPTAYSENQFHIILAYGSPILNRILIAINLNRIFIIWCGGGEINPTIRRRNFWFLQWKDYFWSQVYWPPSPGCTLVPFDLDFLALVKIMEVTPNLSGSKTCFMHYSFPGSPVDSYKTIRHPYTTSPGILFSAPILFHGL